MADGTSPRFAPDEIVPLHAPFSCAMRFLAILLLLTSTLPAEQVGPWNLDALKTQVPAMTWLRQDQPVHSLTYAGEAVLGKPTEVFAFYASPITLGEAKPGGQKKFPGVVLIHGGGGTAFAEWAYLWAKRGYAAIAMDLNGSRPADPEFDANGVAKNKAHDPKSRTRLPNGGLEHGHPQKFDCIGGDTSDDWPFHAAASVMRAHTLLRNFPEVDAEHTAVTGISWGGYTTCLVASLDDRFKAAVPVYGCGFLHEGESVQKPSIDKLGTRAADWVKAYDPGSLLPRCRVPILFVNGTNDVHYVLDSYMKSYNVVPGEKQMRIQVKMPHGHPPGWAPQEIGLFIDSKCRSGDPLPIPGKITVTSNAVQLSYTSAKPLKAAQLHYTTDTGLRSARQWTSVPATINENTITAPQPPVGADSWFISLADDRDAMVSTPVQFKD
jgi:dienelactone hydrolase